jgi:serine/threonine-protein kinase RsbW
VRDAAHEYRAKLASDPLRMRQARRWLTRLVLDAGYAPRDAQDLAVAFSEACANVHRHAYAGRRDGRVDVRVAIDDEEIVVSLDHDGAPLDLGDYAPPDLGLASEGGYGLYLIASLVDDVSFTATGSGGCTVLVKRKRAAEART